MPDFNLITEFITAGLHEKGVLRGWEERGIFYRLALREGKFRREYTTHADAWFADDFESVNVWTDRDIENELLRQLQDRADEQMIDFRCARPGPSFFVDNGGGQYLRPYRDGWDWATPEDGYCFASYPAALLAANVAIVEEMKDGEQE